LEAPPVGAGTKKLRRSFS